MSSETIVHTSPMNVAVVPSPHTPADDERAQLREKLLKMIVDNEASRRQQHEL